MDDLDAVLPVLPSVAAALVLVLTVGLLAPARRPDAGAPVAARSWTSGRVSGLLALAAVVALAVVARFGPVNELDNPASALVVGLGPLAVLLLPLLAAGRARSTDGGPPTVWPAVPVALAVAAYLSAVPGRAAPPRLGAALAACAVVALAAALALGRDAVSRAEPVGLLAGWVALGPRLVRWEPPRGAAAVLAVVLGAAWCERWTRGEAWARLPRDQSDLWLLLTASLLLAAAIATVLQRWSGPVAAAALVPLAVGAVVAAGLRRALISGQLLLEQVGLRERVEPDLLGTVGGQVAALSVVAVAGCLATLVVARRSGEGPARLPALAVVLLVTAVSATVVLQP